MNTQESIALIRKTLNMNTRQFGTELGISHTYVTQLEAGERTPSTDVAQKIKDLAKKAKLKVHIEYEKKFSCMHVEDETKELLAKFLCTDILRKRKPESLR